MSLGKIEDGLPVPLAPVMAPPQPLLEHDEAIRHLRSAVWGRRHAHMCSLCSPLTEGLIIPSLLLARHSEPLFWRMLGRHCHTLRLPMFLTMLEMRSSCRTAVMRRV